MNDYATIYKKELLTNIIPFWAEHSPDRKYGGYFTCLDREGNIFDTDKFVWLQARQVWMFSTLYNQVQRREDWLEIAVHGADFLIKHGRDSEGDWYFSLSREGDPLVQPYNIFSDCFAALGFGALYKATGNDLYAQIARETFKRVLARRSNPKGIYNKEVSGKRKLKNFALPMILSNLSMELEELIPKSLADELIEEVIDEVINDFYSEEKGIILENVTLDGGYSNSMEGRLVNPGHAIEAMWFLMELGDRRKDNDLIQRGKDLGIKMLEYGWDKKFGGIFYFMDAEGYPPQQLEWDQKLWWVHLESLVCMAKGYTLTGDNKAAEWFKRLHEYTWKSFKDSDHPEWFGYLNRQGEVLLPLKGGKWKGCFHVPRAMLQIWKTLEKLPSNNSVLPQPISDKKN